MITFLKLIPLSHAPERGCLQVRIGPPSYAGAHPSLLAPDSRDVEPTGSEEPNDLAVTDDGQGSSEWDQDDLEWLLIILAAELAFLERNAADERHKWGCVTSTTDNALRRARWWKGKVEGWMEEGE